MSNPTENALLARIKVLEKALTDIEVHVNMNAKHSNYQTILMLIKEAKRIVELIEC